MILCRMKLSIWKLFFKLTFKKTSCKLVAKVNSDFPPGAIL